MIKAYIFDMDGVLIDSEPFWRAAEQDAFAEVGIQLSEADCHKTTGLRVDDVVTYWYERQPWEGTSLIAIEEHIVQGVIKRVQAKGKALPGVYELLDLLSTKGLPIALASSSYYPIIEAVVDHLNLRKYFQLLKSAQDVSLAKPHPAVYLETAEALGVSPQHCLAFEDSLFGVIAAKAARMQVYAIPEHYSKKFEVADRVLDSLSNLSAADFRF